MMRWRKYGKIFDPSQYDFGIPSVGYAQSPQTLVLNDRVRIYFSTRTIEPGNAKYLSHIAYVDFDFDFTRVLGVSTHEVVPLGELGAYDEHGIFPINVCDNGSEIFGYLSGWSRRVSVSVETGIGVSMSSDRGRTFQKLGPGPVLTASFREPCLVGDPFVKNINGVFHMWYIFGKGWKEYGPDSVSERIYKIGHAVSQDGINWEKTTEGVSILPDVLGVDECQALPSMVQYADQFHMCFCYREAYGFRQQADRGYRLGYAISEDLSSWTRKDDQINLNINDGEWDSDMQCYPHLFTCREKVYLLYNGNEFGRYGFGLAELISE